MVRIRLLSCWLVVGLLSAGSLRADDYKVDEREEDGIKYRVTTQVVQRPITETRYEPREVTTYRERYTTDMQEVQRTYQVPVTQQQWVPGYQRTWNVFAPPVLSYRLMPVTRWETRSETVRIPVTKRELVPEKLVQQVPVTSTRLAQEEHVHRVPVGHAQAAGGGRTLTASRNDSAGGTRLESDPPRSGPSDFKSGFDGGRP